MCLVLGIERILAIKIMCSLLIITPVPVSVKIHNRGF